MFLGLALTRLVGLLLREGVLTPDEVDGLITGLLTSHAAPTGTTRLAGWLGEYGKGLGRSYVSELPVTSPAIADGLTRPQA